MWRTTRVLVRLTFFFFFCQFSGFAQDITQLECIMRICHSFYIGSHIILEYWICLPHLSTNWALPLTYDHYHHVGNHDLRNLITSKPLILQINAFLSLLLNIDISYI